MNTKNTQKTVEAIRSHYVEREETKLDQIKSLNQKATRPAKIFAYVFGVISTLIFGCGMCLAMNVIGETLHPAIGITIGLIGMALCIINYPVYKAILKKNKQKYSEQILTLCDEALHNESL